VDPPWWLENPHPPSLWYMLFVGRQRWLGDGGASSEGDGSGPEVQRQSGVRLGEVFKPRGRGVRWRFSESEA
jgi:hypothetical protein